MKSAVVVAAFLFLALKNTAGACKVLNWRHMPMPEFLFRADIVVYGKDTERFSVPDESIPGFDTRNDSHFQVYCVFKNDNHTEPIPARITIKGVFPRTSCSGTKYEVGEDVILALKRTEDGLFDWHEVNVVPDGAAFPASATNLQTAVNVCGLINPILPVLPSNVESSPDQPTCPAGPNNPSQCQSFPVNPYDASLGQNDRPLTSLIVLLVFAMIIIFM